VPSPSDLFLSPDLTEEQAQAYLQSLGLRDPAAADRCLQAMAADLGVRLALGEIAGALVDGLTRVADPDAALAGLSAYLATRASKVTFLNHLREDQKALGVLLEIFAAPALLGEMLLRDPEQFPWLMARIDRRPSATIDDDELASAQEAAGVVDLDVLERLHRRQLLRIGVRTLLGHETVDNAVAQLTRLADFIRGRAFDGDRRDLLTNELEHVRAFVQGRRSETGT